MRFTTKKKLWTLLHEAEERGNMWAEIAHASANAWHLSRTCAPVSTTTYKAYEQMLSPHIRYEDVDLANEGVRNLLFQNLPLVDIGLLPEGFKP